MTEITKESTGMNPKIKERIEQIRQGIVPEGYKKTRIGIIPEEWELKTIDDVRDKSDSHSFTGGPFGSNLKVSDYTNEGVRVLQLQNIGDGYFINNHEIYTSEKKANELRSCNIYPNDILISKMADPIARCCIVPNNEKRYLMASDGIRLKPSEDYDPRYLMLLINSTRFRRIAEARATGTTRKRISLGDLRTIPMSIPLREEQQQIAEILSTWDRAIELKEVLIKEKEERKKAITNRLLMPKSHWKSKRLEEIVDRAKGKPVKSFVHGKYKILDTEYLNSKTEPKYTNEAPVFAKKEDILLLWDGSNAGSIYTNFEGVVGSTFMRLRPKGVNNVFIREFMKRDELLIKSIREGSGIPHIPRDFLSYYKIHLPPKKEQDRIAEVLLKLEDQINLLKKELSLLKEQKKGLMQLLLTGIVRVGEVEELE